MCIPLVSIIIPVYNTEKYIGQCLESVIEQTYSNLEIILVDDGSTDGSRKICDEYANKDKRIKVLYQKNGGQAKARNYGIRYAHGIYIVYIDSDDYVSANHIEKMLKLAKQYNADLVQCSMKKFRDGKKEKSKFDKFDITVYSASDALREYCYQKTFTPSPWGKLIHASLMENMEFPVNMGYEDAALMYKVIGKAKTLVFTEEIMYYYRQHKASTMHTPFSDKKVDRIRVAEQFLNYIRENYPENYISAYTRYVLAQLQLLMELPFKKNYTNIKKLAYSNLKHARRIVLNDYLAPIKIKIMTGFSYFGATALMILGRIYMVVTKR